MASEPRTDPITLWDDLRYFLEDMKDAAETAYRECCREGGMNSSMGGAYMGRAEAFGEVLAWLADGANARG